MPTSPRREYAVDFTRDPLVCVESVDTAARLYAAALWAEADAAKAVKAARQVLLAAVERER